MFIHVEFCPEFIFMLDSLTLIFLFTLLSSWLGHTSKSKLASKLVVPCLLHWLPPKCWDYRCMPPSPLIDWLFIYSFIQSFIHSSIYSIFTYNNKIPCFFNYSSQNPCEHIPVEVIFLDWIFNKLYQVQPLINPTEWLRGWG